jgi:4-hydroxythreonine-4-phosphate dehydrogenase
MNGMPNNNSIENQPVIGITMGDPVGIGAEVIVKALSEPEIRKAAKFIIFGMNEQLVYAADRGEIEPFWGRVQHERISREFPYKVVVADYDEYSIPTWLKEANKISGESSARFCLDAIEAAKRKIIDAVVTAPINKTSWKLANIKWPGHTEMFAEKTKSKRKVMMFACDKLKVALATIHEALFDLHHKFTIGCVYEPIDLMNDALKDYFDIEKPRIGVAALNPHAGENGRFGDEESRIISPAIELARHHDINCTGPYPADTLFYRAVNGEFDGVVAMYHDQAMIPIKLIAFDEAVNITIGIPIIRTSPAHGTAFDITGKNIANPASMKAAILTAIKMVKVKMKRAQGIQTNITEKNRDFKIL